jgi:hypothetical protein
VPARLISMGSSEMVAWTMSIAFTDFPLS